MKHTTHTEASYILSGDVGGTNTSLAIVECVQNNYRILDKKSFQSQNLQSLDEAIHTVLEQFTALIHKHPISGACFTVAGPVLHNTVKLTNVPWGIDGNSLGKTLGFPVFLINDISGICYGLPLLDKNNPEELVALNEKAFDKNDTDQSVQAVVAPGTGLGVGYLVHTANNYFSLPAEAGHIDWAPYSDETLELFSYVNKLYGVTQGVESYISGRGIENIFRFITQKFPQDACSKEILHSAPGSWGSQIAQAYGSCENCTKTMLLFIEMLGRYASSVALWILPKNGLFLSGGIPGKNKALLLEDDRFMKSFRRNYQPGIAKLLEDIPVYITLNYSINLSGAAHAFDCLSK